MENVVERPYTKAHYLKIEIERYMDLGGIYGRSQTAVGQRCDLWPSP